VFLSQHLPSGAWQNSIVITFGRLPKVSLQKWSGTFEAPSARGRRTTANGGLLTGRFLGAEDVIVAVPGRTSGIAAANSKAVAAVSTIRWAVEPLGTNRENFRSPFGYADRMLELG